MVKSLPIKLLFECKPYVITIETKNGDRYRGNLKFIEENMIFFFRDGTTKGVGQVLKITDNLDGIDFANIENRLLVKSNA